jgi:putative ABC transport system permease protein
MFRNYLKPAIRSIVRGGTYSIINIAGLSVGLATCILILLWVQDELSFDLFHRNVRDICRVISYKGNLEDRSAGTPAPLGPALKEGMPDVISFTRFAAAPGKIVVKHGNNSFYEDRIVFADPAVFDMFTFPFLEGDRTTALSGLSNVVIPERIAKKYFGSEDPLGKVLTIEGEADLVVSGVIHNIPGQSHIQFDLLLSFQNVYALHMLGTEWGDFNFTTYVMLRPGSFNSGLNAQATEIAAAHHCPQVVYAGRSFGLQPMTEVHLDAGAERAGTEITADTGNRESVVVFSLVALLTLVAACFNFMNISTARSEGRRKEVAMRKTLGAQRYQLAVQFICESVFMAIVACGMAVVWMELALPVFNALTAKDLSLDFSDLRFVLNLLGITLLTGVLAGSYPALYLSSFSPTSVLRLQGSGPRHGLRGFLSPLRTSVVRRFLVVAQFSLSIGLIICTLVAVKQVSYMLNKDTGFDRENVIVVPVRENFGSNYRGIKNRLLGNTSVIGVTAQDWFQVQGPRNMGGGGYDWEGNPDPLRSPLISHAGVDFDFIRTMKMTLVDGRDFSEDHPGDASGAFIVNEEAVKVMGLTSPVGKRFRLYDREGLIIGVMRDACFSSLHKRVEPLVYQIMTDVNDARSYGAVLVRLRASARTEGIAAVEKIWKSENPNSPFEFQFLDDAMNRRYTADRKTEQIFGAFAFVALVISCLGAFGLASYTAETRTKEIGIRKVLGASVVSILILLTGEFLKWVLLANLIAWPVAWYSVNRWLQDFAYRIDISVVPFAAGGVLVLAVALCTVAWQALRAATGNPIKAMRYE